MDLGVRARVLLIVAWIAVQAALIFTGGKRADAAFAFRMFPESSTMSISLARELENGQTVAVEGGSWHTHDALGAPHDHAWTDRVKDPVLSHLDVTVAAAYGSDAQLSRLQAALDDAITHLDDDVETRRFVATVSVRKNGRDPVSVTLFSRGRP
jgi:hypothetical protein